MTYFTDCVCCSINSFHALSRFIHVIWRLLAKETIYIQEVNGSDSAHALTSTGYFCKDDFFKISFEKDFRSTQGKGGNNNAQMKYVILFPFVIQSMW